MPSPDIAKVTRAIVLEWWAKHPHLSARKVREHFTAGPGVQALPEGARIPTPGGLRTWKSKYGLPSPSPSPSSRLQPKKKPSKPIIGKMHEQITIAYESDDGPVTLAFRRDRAVFELLRCRYPKSDIGPMVGVSAKTIYNWVNRGKDEEEGPYRDFLVGYMEASATARKTVLNKIERLAAERGDWRGYAWLAERLWPNHFREQKTVRTETADTNPNAMTPAQIEALRQLAPEQIKALRSVDLDAEGAVDDDIDEEEGEA